MPNRDCSLHQGIIQMDPNNGITDVTKLADYKQFKNYIITFASKTPYYINTTSFLKLGETEIEQPQPHT